MAAVKDRKSRPGESRSDGSGPTDIGTFKRMPPAVLDRLIAKGRKGEPRSGELCSGPIDLGTFKRMPPAVLDRLIAKGRKDAEELDRQIRDQFVMTTADAQMRLD
jgi:hypothetical protein